MAGSRIYRDTKYLRRFRWFEKVETEYLDSRDGLLNWRQIWWCHKPLWSIYLYLIGKVDRLVKLQEAYHLEEDYQGNDL